MCCRTIARGVALVVRLPRRRVIAGKHCFGPAGRPMIALIADICGDGRAWEVAMEIVLYYGPVTCALAPYITLTEAGAKFEVRPLNFRKDQHRSPGFLKINPKHKVPVLLVDGQILTESVAIQMWIAR